jgi:hypothetical protein
MQALDSFDGDIPIPVVPVLAQPPSNDDASDSSTRSSASASKTRASKRKVVAKPDSSEKGQESDKEIFKRDQNRRTHTQSSCFDSSIGSSVEDPESSLKKVYSS